MVKRRRVYRTAFVALALLATACGPDGPTLVAGDETTDDAVEESTAVTDAAESTSPVADDSPPTERDVPLSQLVQDELVLGYVWQLDQNEVVDDWARFIFYGSENAPRIQIESACGVGELTIERRRSDLYRIDDSSWEGCERDPLRKLLDDEGAVTASTTVQSFDSLTLRIGDEEFTLSQLDGLPFTTDEFDYPSWTFDREDDGGGVIPDFTPVPELSAEDIAAEPLMKNITVVQSIEDNLDLTGYLAIIGSSQYALVDEAGEPLVVREGDGNKLRLMITAYHGADTPVVYIAFMDHYSHIDPSYGVQSGSDCEGGMFLGGLVAGPDDTYKFTNEVAPVFDDRIFFGDYMCGGYDLDPQPDMFNSPFTIDTSTKDTLIMTNEDGSISRFALLTSN